jgi:hypothetical protein
MWTFKNLIALGLFLFGTTFMWMTAYFAGRANTPTGTAWTLVNVLALAAVVGFAIAGWGVFKQHSWWETTALVSAVVGLLAAIPFIIGLRQLQVGFADLGVQINLWMHIVGSAVVIAIVRLPVAHDWVSHRL